MKNEELMVSLECKNARRIVKKETRTIIKATFFYFPGINTIFPMYRSSLIKTS